MLIGETWLKNPHHGKGSVVRVPTLLPKDGPLALPRNGTRDSHSGYVYATVHGLLCEIVKSLSSYLLYSTDLASAWTCESLILNGGIAIWCVCFYFFLNDFRGFSCW